MFGKILSFTKGRAKEGPQTADEIPMKCCPECGAEFRPEFSTCALCDVDLVLTETPESNNSVADEKRKERDMHISPEDELVSMRQGSLLEMKTVQHLLKKENIGSLLVEDRGNCGPGCSNSKVFELKVKKEYAGDAQQILIDEFRRSTSFDSHEFEGDAEAVFDQRMSEARCPACGSTFITDDRTCPECGLCF